MELFFMTNPIIVTPLIKLYEKQVELTNAIFELEHKEIKIDNEQYIQFLVNNNPYTLTILKDPISSIFIVKDHINNKKIIPHDIVLKTTFNAGLYNDISDKKLDAIKLFKPSLNTNIREVLNNYISFDKEAFKDITSILGNFGAELYSLYEKEYETVNKTINYYVRNLMETISKNIKLQNETYIEDAIEMGLFFKTENFLAYCRDSYTDLIQVDEDSITFYSIDTDEYCKTLTEEQYENENTLFFNYEDILNRFNEVKKELFKYEVAKIGVTELSGDIFSLNMSIHNIKENNSYFFKKFNIVDESKKLKVNDLNDVNYTLMTSSDFYWFEDSLYNPNAISGIDFSYFKDFIEPSDYEYALVCNSPLMTEYSSSLNEEWKNAVFEAIEFSKTLLNSFEDDMLNIAKDNLDKIIKYRDKTLN